MNREQYIAILEVDNAELKKENKQLKKIFWKLEDWLTQEIIKRKNANPLSSPVQINEFYERITLETVYDFIQESKGESNE